MFRRDVRNIRVEIKLYLNIVHFKLMAENFEDVPDRIVDIHLAFNHVGLSRKIPDMLDDAGGPFDTDSLAQGAVISQTR